MRKIAIAFSALAITGAAIAPAAADARGFRPAPKAGKKNHKCYRYENRRVRVKIRVKCGVHAKTSTVTLPQPYRHTPVANRRCFRLWKSRTGTHRSRVTCHGKRPGTVFRGGHIAVLSGAKW